MKALIIILLSCTFLCNADEVLTRNERIIALTLLGEARGEGKRGLFAVGCVIQRRSWEKKINAAQVCLQKWQFSIWNGTDRQGKYRLKKESELYHLWDSKEMMYARHLARCLNKDDITLMDITEGANHYCTLKCKPYWAFKMEKEEDSGLFQMVAIKPTKIIGNHKFYKLP